MTESRMVRCRGCDSRHDAARGEYGHRFCEQCELAADIAAEYGREYFAGGFRVPAKSLRDRMAALRRNSYVGKPGKWARLYPVGVPFRE